MLEKLYNALKYFWSLLGFNAQTTNDIHDMDGVVLRTRELDNNLNLELFTPYVPEFTIDVNQLQRNLDLQRMAFNRLIDVSSSLTTPSILLPQSPQPAPLPPQVFDNPSEENNEQLTKLPVEIWLRIFIKLPIPTLLKAMTACKYFGELTNDPILRKAMAQEKGQRSQIEFFNNINLLKLYHVEDFVKTNQPEEDIYSEPGAQGFILKGKR
ncbi:F-box protein [Legionella lytica]|uniref:F-box protein n=1 Tax=Legionella lytica TaxID=96232 RepID=A0ABY4YAM4_9GAMM|nr:F-box protein [Legionella lytica]USQ14698.1 F-box protein [Legionella lytica]